MPASIAPSSNAASTKATPPSSNGLEPRAPSSRLSTGPAPSNPQVLRSAVAPAESKHTPAQTVPSPSPSTSHTSSINDEEEQHDEDEESDEDAEHRELVARIEARINVTCQEGPPASARPLRQDFRRADFMPGWRLYEVPSVPSSTPAPSRPASSFIPTSFPSSQASSNLASLA